MDPHSTALTLLVFLSVCTGSQAISQCTWDSSSCGCKSDKGLISLKKYADSPFSDQDPVTLYTYYWSPCKDISKGLVQGSCLQGISTSLFYDCGAYSTISTTVENDNPVFHMDAGDLQRHSLIKCICKTNGVDTFKFDGEDPVTPGIYDLSLTGDVCCPKAGPSPGGGGAGSGGLSVGSILLIVALVLLIVYVVAGTAVQIGVRKAEGKERVPNLSFWSAIPGLIRDGFRFTFSCGKSSRYNEI